MLRKTLFIAAFACAAVVGGTNDRFEPQIGGSARAQDLTSELRGACMGLGFAPGTSAYRDCLVLEAERRQPDGSYASHFHQPGMHYDQKGQLVDAGGYLIDRSGRRIGGQGYWVSGARDDIVPPGTRVDPAGRALTIADAPPANAISLPNETVARRGDRQGSVTTCIGFVDATGEQSTCAVTRQMTSRQAQAQRRASEQQFQAQLRASCGAYGLAAGTPVFNECLAREAHERR